MSTTLRELVPELVLAMLFALVCAVAFAIIGEKNVKAFGKLGPRRFFGERRVMKRQAAMAKIRANMPKPMGATAVQQNRRLTVTLNH